MTRGWGGGPGQHDRGMDQDSLLWGVDQDSMPRGWTTTECPGGWGGGGETGTAFGEERGRQESMSRYEGPGHMPGGNQESMPGVGVGEGGRVKSGAHATSQTGNGTRNVFIPRPVSSPFGQTSSFAVIRNDSIFLLFRDRI